MTGIDIREHRAAGMANDESIARGEYLSHLIEAAVAALETTPESAETEAA